MNNQAENRLPGEAVAWRDLADAPHGVPVLVQYHEWNDKRRSLAEQVAWFYNEAWRPYPAIDGEAYADRWKPLIPASDLEQVSREREGLRKALADMILLAEVASAMISDRDLFKRTERRISKARAALNNLDNRNGGPG